MSGFGIQILGGEELKRAFDNAPKIFNDYMGRAIQRIAFQIEAKAKINAPIDRGGLRSSIHTEGPKQTLSGLEATVGTDLEYAPYQEFGTGIYAGKGPITPKRARILAWKKDGQWIFARSVRGVRPKRFFERAKEDVMNNLGPFLQDGLKEITVELSK